jgi:hypothetical protein
MFNPLPLLSNAFNAVTGFFGGIQTYLIIGTVALAVGAASGAWVGYRIESGKVAAIQTADVEAETQAVQAADKNRAAQDAVTLASALKEANAQERVVTVTQTITKEIPAHVPPKVDATVCVPYGLMRLLDASALQADPDSLGLPTGQSDGSCSPVKTSALAESVINNYGVAEANAEQLTALQAWVLADEKAQTP